jgi:hypothetical protein
VTTPARSSALAGALASPGVAWGAIAAASLAIFTALVTAGRPPTVDLPAQANMLRHFIDASAPGYDGPYDLVLTAGYTGVYWLGRVFVAAGLDPERAVDVVTALAVALLPLSSAAVARSLGRSPAYGLFACAAAFGSILGWGFVAMILGVDALGFAIAAACAYSTKGTFARAALVVAAVMLAYAMHFAAWLVALPSVAFICVARTLPDATPRSLLRAVAPSLVAALPTFAAWALWRSHPASQFRAFRTEDGFRYGPDPFARVLELPFHLAGFGAHVELAALCAALIVAVAAVVAIVGARSTSFASTSWRTSLARYAPACVGIGCVVAYFAAPLDYQGAFFTYPRFIPMLAVLAPACLPRLDGNQRALPLTALAPVIVLAWLARAECADFSAITHCLDDLANSARDDESLVPLTWLQVPPGYREPVFIHNADVIIAKKGGRLPFDFVDMNVGSSSVGYRPGFTREMPHWDDWHPDHYDHKSYGVEFTAWLLTAPPKPLGEIFGAQQGWRVDQCGPFVLVTDASVAAGSKPATRFLPHRAR